MFPVPVHGEGRAGEAWRHANGEILAQDASLVRLARCRSSTNANVAPPAAGGRGEVRVTEVELARLAAFKGLNEHDFIQQFMRRRPDRRGLALAERPNGESILLDGNDCSVQPPNIEWSRKLEATFGSGFQECLLLRRIKACGRRTGSCRSRSGECRAPV
jgi:hypothetical protein